MVSALPPIFAARALVLRKGSACKKGMASNYSL